MSAGRTAPVLEINGLRLGYDGEAVVPCLDLEISGPGITALIGPSGCGKTSLLRAIAGFLVPQAGRIRLLGREVCGPTSWVEPEERRVGMVFQEGALFPHLTVLRNVLYGIHRRPGAEELALAALERVGLAELAERYPDQLSGGQRQRVALARAMAPAPELILLDEPFASLDAELRVRVREDVRTVLAKAGATAVLVTHDQEEALSVADHLVVMDRGQVLQTGTPYEVYNRPTDIDVVRFLGDGRLIDCSVDQGVAETPFGKVSVKTGQGRASLVLRPEDFRIVAVGRAGGAQAGEDAEAGRKGVLDRRRFFGHDYLDEVLLDDGERVAVRGFGAEPLTIGARVNLRLVDRIYHALGGPSGIADAGGSLRSDRSD